MHYAPVILNNLRGKCSCIHIFMLFMLMILKRWDKKVLFYIISIFANAVSFRNLSPDAKRAAKDARVRLENRHKK